jgi:hypothetical protein
MKESEPDQSLTGSTPPPGKSMNLERRNFLKTGLWAGTFGALGMSYHKAVAENAVAEAAEKNIDNKESSIVFGGPSHLRNAMQLAANTYAPNRVKDMLSRTNDSGYRMTVSPNGFPVALCMSPDLTFGMLGSRFMENRDYLDTFIGHMNFLPRNMRRNGKFFINEDMLAGAGRVFSQVVYLIWVWELYLSTGDKKILTFHHEPLKHCLGYIESRTDAQGIVTQVDPDDWQYSEGADWVDWCPERMEGSTCVYHTWYAHALRGCARIFEILGDVPAKELCEERMNRQQQVLTKHFWNGEAYWDNLNFQGEKVGRFWCDSQIWPIAFGFSSEQQASKIFGRIDAEPEIFEGMPLRWCAPIKPGEEDPRYLRGGKYADTKRPELRQFTWFGRLGSGDILARYRTGQDEHAFNLINKYAKVVSESGTLTECLDMEGKAQRGTSGQGNYLEHAGGLLWCTAKGLFGVDDTIDGTINWTPRIPASIKEASMPFWHFGNCWKFGCDEKNYWIDPGKAVEKVRVTLNGKSEEIQLDGKKIHFPRAI